MAFEIKKQGKAYDVCIVGSGAGGGMAAKILSEASGQTYEKVLEDLERDKYMDAEASIAYGLVDKIVDKL